MIPPLPPKKYQTKELDLPSLRNNYGKDMEVDNQNSDFLTSSSHSMPTNQPRLLEWYLLASDMASMSYE